MCQMSQIDQRLVWKSDTDIRQREWIDCVSRDQEDRKDRRTR